MSLLRDLHSPWKIILTMSFALSGCAPKEIALDADTTSDVLFEEATTSQRDTSAFLEASVTAEAAVDVVANEATVSTEDARATTDAVVVDADAPTATTDVVPILDVLVMDTVLLDATDVSPLDSPGETSVGDASLDVSVDAVLDSFVTEVGPDVVSDVAADTRIDAASDASDASALPCLVYTPTIPTGPMLSESDIMGRYYCLETGPQPVLHQDVAILGSPLRIQTLFDDYGAQTCSVPLTFMQAAAVGCGLCYFSSPVRYSINGAFVVSRRGSELVLEISGYQRSSSAPVFQGPATITMNCTRCARTDVPCNSWNL